MYAHFSLSLIFQWHFSVCHLNRLINVFWVPFSVSVSFYCTTSLNDSEGWQLWLDSANKILWSWLRSIIHLSQFPLWLSWSTLQYVTHKRSHKLLWLPLIIFFSKWGKEFLFLCLSTTLFIKAKALYIFFCSITNL